MQLQECFVCISPLECIVKCENLTSWTTKDNMFENIILALTVFKVSHMKCVFMYHCAIFIFFLTPWLSQENIITLWCLLNLPDSCLTFLDTLWLPDPHLNHRSIVCGHLVHFIHPMSYEITGYPGDSVWKNPWVCAVTEESLAAVQVKDSKV